MERNVKCLFIFILALGPVFCRVVNLGALPEEIVVITGTVFFTESSNELLKIDQQSGKASVQCGDFTVSLGEKIEILQPGPQSKLVIDVNGTRQARISGGISANGKVMINSAKGFVVYSGARFQAGRLVFNVGDRNRPLSVL